MGKQTFGAIIDARVFEMKRDPIDVTTLNRPDPKWSFTDAAGHVHQWHVGGKPAKRYSPAANYELPTLRWIVDEPATDDWPEEGHYECITCGATAVPGTCADTIQQFIAGPARCYIDGIPVSRETFETEFEKAKKARQDAGGQNIDYD
jgi:hypothetical protein